MKEDTRTLSVCVSASVFDFLESVGSNWKYPPGRVAGLLISTLFEKAPDVAESKSRFIDRTLRRDTHIPCVLKFTRGADITCKPGHIVDISLGGLGIAIDGAVSAGSEPEYTTPFFEVIAQLGKEEAPSSFLCRNCYALKNSHIKLGGQFLEPDSAVFMQFLKAFMRANHMRAIGGAEEGPASPS